MSTVAQSIAEQYVGAGGRRRATEQHGSAADILKGMAMLLAAPFIGFAYAAVYGFAGLAIVGCYGLKTLGISCGLIRT